MEKNKIEGIVKLLKSTPEVVCPLYSNKELDDLKKKLVNCLYSDNFCSLCLTQSQPLALLGDNLSIFICNENKVMSVRYILKKILHIEVNNFATNSLICLPCRAKAISAFLFITETLNNLNAIKYYTPQMEESVVDSVMEVDGDTVTKQSNVVLILENPPVNNNMATDETDNGGKPKTFICHFCGESKATKSAITLHYRSKHGICRNITTNSIYRRRDKCIECKTTKGCVHTKYIMYYQNQRRSGKMLATCRACPYSCWGKRNLLDHIDDKHLRFYKYTCDKCQKKFPSNMAYKFHIRKYHTKLYKCKYCDSGEYANKARLLKHEVSCKKVKRQFACDKCPATFDTEKKLLYHKNKHNNNFQCLICTKSFAKEFKLKAHQRLHILIGNEKNPTYRHKCSICQLQLYTSQDFKAHVAEKHKPDDKHHCAPCKQDFDTRIQFLNHISKYSHRVKLNPNIKKPFECERCDYSSTSATAFESHMNRYHLKIKPFKCESCPKSFTDNQKLKHHAKTHSKIKTHKCLYCDVFFCGPSALKKHIRRHTGERPYSCNICKQRFLSSSMLVAHQRRTHFASCVRCPKCTTVFACLPQMRMHFKRSHWDYGNDEFDINRVEGLTEEERDMFRDRRMINFEEDHESTL